MEIEKSNEMPGNEIVTTESNAVAPASMSGSLTDQLLASLGAKLVKQVTRTVLQQKDGVPFAVHFESAAIESEVTQETKGGKPKMAPARVCDVVDIADGSKKILIMNTVLEGELSRAYPELSYVGKQFLLRSHFPVGSDGKAKNYKVYEIIEISVDYLSGKVQGESVVADGTEPVGRNGKPKS
jgi:hypothetical protein